jgi:hypothetical protein
MDTDLILVIGITLAALTIPSLLAAFSESRPPRAAAVLMLIAGTMIVVALTQRPSGYAFADIPQTFMRVFGRLMN